MYSRHKSARTINWIRIDSHPRQKCKPHILHTNWDTESEVKKKQRIRNTVDTKNRSTHAGRWSMMFDSMLDVARNICVVRRSSAGSRPSAHSNVLRNCAPNAYGFVGWTRSVGRNAKTTQNVSIDVWTHYGTHGQSKDLLIRCADSDCYRASHSVRKSRYRSS